MFFKQSFQFLLDYAEIVLGFLNWGFFEKGVGNYDFGQIFFKILIGLCPICFDCICFGPLWHFNHVFRHISMCSCIAHMCSVV